MTTTCGPELIDMLLTTARRQAFDTSCRSDTRSGMPLPMGEPGIFSKLVR